MKRHYHLTELSTPLLASSFWSLRHIMSMRKESSTSSPAITPCATPFITVQPPHIRNTTSTIIVPANILVRYSNNRSAIRKIELRFVSPTLPVNRSLSWNAMFGYCKVSKRRYCPTLGLSNHLNPRYTFPRLPQCFAASLLINATPRVGKL